MSKPSSPIAKTPKKQTAKLEQVLFYLDNPEVISLAFDARSKIVAVATNNLTSAGFFGAKVSVKQFNEYLTERFDLRYLFMNADREIWYKFDIADFNDQPIELNEVNLTKSVVDAYVPDHGFFARSHTQEYKFSEIDKGSVQRFNVDGNWDMKEFSKFHSHVSDLYGLTYSIDEFLDDQASIDKKREIMSAFVKPWEGGGSYYGFFNSMAKTGGRSARPDIKAIQWASPGYIDIKGEQASFDRLVELLKTFGRNRNKIVEEYDHLWSYLQEIKLLKSSSARLDKSSEEAKEVGSRAQSLSKLLNVTHYRTLKKMAGNDPVVAAKVLLATKRRVEKLYIFFAEGRVAIANETVS